MNSKRIFHVFVSLVIIATLLSFYQPAMTGKAQDGGVQITRETAYMPGEVVVSFYDGSTSEMMTAATEQAAKTFGVQVARASEKLVLLRGDAQLNVEALVKELQQQPGVQFAEPNYIYWIPEPASTPEGAQRDTEHVYRAVPDNFNKKEFIKNGKLAVPVELLQNMKTKRNGKVQAVYPNDDYLWDNWGWSYVGADIVSSNNTASAGVCVIDTGVDYQHKDLAGQVIKGYDFINDDADPMDDHGHGTHVAGVIVAKKGNSEGIAGVSTGKVVAVKALTAQGWGTNFDIASAINYCANRTDIRVINMSLGGPYYSALIENAVNYAVNTRLKLLVAAAGNANTSSPFYPAYFAAYAQYYNKVLAVAASGVWWYDPEYDEYWFDYDCRAEYSNYGGWVSVAAPGTDIFSTLPWDKPFYMSWGPTRYGSLSGTSMAAPFVAASAARRWGYKPLDSNEAIGAAVVESGDQVYTGGGCWPGSMAGKNFVNVASLLDRGGAYAYAYDASNGNPLNGATIYLYRGATLLGNGTIKPYTYKASPTSTDPNRIYTYFTAWTDLINLPVGGWYDAKLHKSGYTASQQLAFQDWGRAWIGSGEWSYLGEAYVPPRSSNFDVVLDWEGYWEYDLDVNLWLPNTPNPLDPGQPAPFIVGPEGDAFGYLEGDPTGALVAFPYARYRYGFFDWPSMEDIVIKKRYAHGIPANSYLPYYAGEYAVYVTDYGQTVDHDYDGCGDNYGWGWDPYYNPAADPDCPPNDPTGTLGWSLLRYVPWYQGPVSVFIWKDGVIKARTSLNGGECAASAHWWDAMRIFSTPSATATSPTYGYTGWCGSADIVAYSAAPYSGRYKVDR